MKYPNSIFFFLFVAIMMGCTKNTTTNGGTTGGGGNAGGGTGGSVSAPITVSVVANTVTTNSFTASWAKVTGANSYFVYVASDSFFTQPISVYNPVTVTDTNLVVSNLTANTSYYFRVKASVNGVTSDFSKTVTATTQGIAKKWQTVGIAGFSVGAVVYNTALAIDTSNAPCVAFQDGGNNKAATVMRYNGSTWALMGSAGFSTANITTISMAIGKNNIPYVLYGESTGYATVKKYVSGSWVTVGNAQFIDIGPQSSSIAVDNNGTPFIAVIDWGIGHTGQASVLKFINNTWTYVGASGFSTANLLAYISLALDASGNPNVAYDDGHGSSVQKWNGTQWVYLGGARFNGAYGGYTSMAIDKNNNPYIIYSSSNGGFSIPTCMMYNNSTSAWTTIGGYFTGGSLDFYPVLAIDPSGVPYMAFQDNNGVNHAATAMNYSNGAWVTVGNAGFSAGYITGFSNNIDKSTLSITIDKNGIPYVAYGDDNSSGTMGKVTVMKYN